jgi:preprotein translocase subunit SecD
LKDLLQQTAALSFHLLCDEMSVDEALRTRPPAGCYLAYSVDDPVQPYLLQSRALIQGDQLADAQPGFRPANAGSHRFISLQHLRRDAVRSGHHRECRSSPLPSFLTMK